MSLLLVPDLLDLHDAVLEAGDSSPGLLLPENLEMIVGRADSWVFGVERFPGVFRKAASYAEGIATLHPFLDGNKRTAYLAAGHYLARNGYVLREIDDTDAVMVRLAKKQMSLEQFADWLEANC